jgi:DNA-binding Lrp family transcriptional regulator
MSAPISRDEWLAALGDAIQVNPHAVTCLELAAKYGFSRKAMGERLKKLVDAGRARRTVTIRDGRRCPAYVLVNAHEARPATRKR